MFCHITGSETYLTAEGKVRLDLLLLERGFSPNRSRAQALIMSGKVLVEGKLVDKPGATFLRDAHIELKAPPSIYVSRGGEKLASALEILTDLKIKGRICIDVGASTGGFTDLLLGRGAELVYAVDVGRALLHERLRFDNRVVVLEGVNARYLNPDQFPKRPSLAVVDVSFISLRLILPPLVRIMDEPDDILVLFKPQFEVGRERVSKGGVVRKPRFVSEALMQIISFAQEVGVFFRAIVASAVFGPKGNREFFVWFNRPGVRIAEEKISSQVNAAVVQAFEKRSKGANQN